MRTEEDRPFMVGGDGPGLDGTFPSEWEAIDFARRSIGWHDAPVEEDWDPVTLGKFTGLECKLVGAILDKEHPGCWTWVFRVPPGKENPNNAASRPSMPSTGRTGGTT